MTTDQKGCLACIGFPIFFASLSLLGPIGGVIGIVIFLWIISLGGGIGGDDWNGRP